ncbi:S-adenosylmethionine synthase domain protein [Mycobacterium xenopi 4042]|uniref:S-adenosylmethionine synthase domain protein n=1 Tax=Mycobacterium xenopi 4042 TaxID=1299334 RepID=X7YQH7_MYCXE|nr:S-adenosylmethionine synthase domain protein [Mycobacterium xenopi 4042]
MLTPDIREKVLNTVLDDLAHDTLDASEARLLVNPPASSCSAGPWATRVDRPQNHRRHLRWLGTPRWRRLLRQGSLQSGPLGGVCDALGG